MLSSLLFHNALQRMLVLLGQVHNLCHFGFGNLVGKDPTFANTILVHMQHYVRGLVRVLVEKPLEHVNDELHRCKIIVEQQHAIKAGSLGFGFGFCDDNGAAVLVKPITCIAAIWVAHIKIAALSEFALLNL